MGKRFTTDEEKEIVAEYIRGESVLQLSKKWNCNYRTVRNVMVKYGVLPPEKPSPHTERVIAEYNKGKTVREISESTGVRVATVYEILSSNGLEHNQNRRTEAVKRKIADGLRNGEKNQEIADRLGVSRQYVSRLALQMGFPKGHAGKPKKSNL